VAQNLQKTIKFSLKIYLKILKDKNKICFFLQNFGFFVSFGNFWGFWKKFLRWQAHQHLSGVQAALHWLSGRASTATPAQLVGSRPASGRS
jgi:hypothetical protein